MGKILETDKLTKSRWMQFNGVGYYEVDTVGDGNCAFNSIALAMLDLIKRGQLNLSSEDQQKLVAALKDKEVRRTLYARIDFHASYLEAEAMPYDDLVQGMGEFYKFTGTDFTYPQLVQHIIEHSKTRQQIAELHLALAPALRKIGAELYQQYYSDIGDDETLQDAVRISKDGEWAGPDHMAPLAQSFLGVNLMVHVETGVANYNADPNPNLPTIHILSVPGHLNFMLPADQNEGLAAVLTTVSPLATAQSQFAKMTSMAQKMMAAINPATIIAQLNELKKTVSQAAKSLFQLQVGDKANQFIEKSVADTKAMMSSLRQHLDLSDENKKISSLSAMQKDILRGNYQQGAGMPLAGNQQVVASNLEKDKAELDVEAVVMPAEARQAQIRRDELLALTLQESEVLSFLKYKGWSKFFRKPEKVMVPPAAELAAHVPSMVEVK